MNKLIYIEKTMFEWKGGAESSDGCINIIIITIIIITMVIITIHILTILNLIIIIIIIHDVYGSID